MLTAYQEGLATLEQLRQRMPHLRRQEQAVQSELLSLAEAKSDQSRYLRLLETLAQFRERLRAQADSLEVGQRQKILRLLVKEILVGKETVTIRHSIPTPHSGSEPDGSPEPIPVPSSAPSSTGYLLRSGSHYAALRSSASAALSSYEASLPLFVLFLNRNFEPQLDEPQYVPVHDSPSHAP